MAKMKENSVMSCIEFKGVQMAGEDKLILEGRVSWTLSEEKTCFVIAWNVTKSGRVEDKSSYKTGENIVMGISVLTFFLRLVWNVLWNTLLEEWAACIYKLYFWC